MSQPEEAQNNQESAQQPTYNAPEEGYQHQAGDAYQQGYQQNYGYQDPQTQQGQMPQQGYGVPAGYGYGAPAPQASGFAALFSTNFASRATQSIAKIVMLMAIILAGVIAVNGLWNFIELLSSDYVDKSFVMVLGALIEFVLDIVKAIFLLGATRLFIEYFVNRDKEIQA